MKILFLASFLPLLLLKSCSGADERCGGTFNGLQYQVKSPNYPNNYPINEECVYILKGSDRLSDCDQEFHLQFVDFKLESSKRCDKDYLKVGDDNVYCGDGSIGARKFRSKDKTLKLVFHSDKNTTEKGFRILVTTLPCVDVRENNTETIKPEIEDRVDKLSSKIRDDDKTISKNLSEILELPKYEQQRDFNDEYRGHSNSVNENGVRSVTSYLYLPPSPLKISSPNDSPVIRNDSPIKHFDDNSPVRVTELRPTENPTPHDQIPLPFVPRINHRQSETQFQPFRHPAFHDSTNRWQTYGTPNAQIPSINTNNDFDPFANYNPNCGASNDDNYNPGWENSAPGYVGNANPYYPENVNNFATGNNNNNYYGTDDTTYSYDVGSTASECCGTIYSSTNFLLTSRRFPAFVYSSSNYDCRYTIQRSSANVCGLEINLRFFNFGSDDQFCAYGYVEIDGSRLCGCRTGANITSSFDNISRKVINVKYVGYPRNKFGGFLLEVSQTPCTTNYLKIKTDDLERDGYDFIEHFQRSNDRSIFRSRRNSGYYYDRPNNGGLTTSTSNAEKLQFINTCKIFKFVNWVKAAKQVYLRSAQCSAGGTTLSSGVSVIPIFPDNLNSDIINFQSPATASNCEIVNVVQGTVTSPYYPNNYANNLNRCYRFYKAPGYCQLELAILDFDLENSTICRKDYVSFSGQKRRYCGNSLARSQTIIDMTRTSFADLYFVTDSSGTGRGFRAGFSQISC